MSRDRGTAVSVVVVTHDSRDAVRAALPALCTQLGARDELVVVDNASRDDTLSVVGGIAPGATVVRNERNTGFAAGANAGADAARGELLVFLNPDATPAPGFLDAIRAPRSDGRRWAAWMGLVTSAGGRLVNTNGGVVHYTGIAWSGEAGAPAPGNAVGPREVGFVSGACLAVTRRDWDRVGGFADEYFMYHEDVDLSLRLRLAGDRVGVEPAAVVDHEYEFAKGPAKWRRLERNRWATILRCYPGPLLVAVAPALVATELALLVVAAAGGWLPQKLLAAVDTILALPRLVRQRRRIQATRAISTAEFASALTPALDSRYLGAAAQNPLLQRAVDGYWRLVLGALRVF